MPQVIKAQQGRHWTPDFAIVFIADKPECNINFGSDSVDLPYLNTTQVSAKSE